MEKIQLLLLSADKEYNMALGRALAQRPEQFCVELDNPALRTIKEEDKAEYDLILIDEKRYTDGEKVFGGFCEQLVLLSEYEQALPYENTEEGPKDSREKDPLKIWKYGGAKRIASELLFYCLRHRGNALHPEKSTKAKVLVFTAASGNVGKTSLAISCARELSRYHRQKTLFLSLESPLSADLYLPYDHCKSGLNDYLYYMFSKYKNKKAPDPCPFLSKDLWGVEYFRQNHLRNEASELTAKELEHFLSEISWFCSYDYICLDFPSSLCETCFTVFDLADGAAIISDGGAICEHKNEKLLKAYEARGKTGKKLRVISVLNRWNAESERIPPDRKDIVISFDESSFFRTDGSIEIEMDRSFGLGVKKLAEKIRGQI